MIQNTCCLTGHRPQSLPWGFREEDPRCRVLKARLEGELLRAVRERGVRHFLSGMALGADTWGAEGVLALGEHWPVTLECVIPCGAQPDRWSRESRERYHAILRRAHKVTVLQREYTPDCFARRNRWMVDRSGLLIALWDGSASGTGSTVEYARQLGREVWVLRP